MPKTTFSASRISELLAEGSGKTALSYCLDLALNSIGEGKQIDTAPMRHGSVNQYNAFDLVVNPLFPDAIWFDEYVPINELCGASPDVLINGNIPLDIKCPYNIDNYVALCFNTPKKYYAQMQMQMLATGAEYSYLMPYLTKPETFSDDEWCEYPFPIDERYKLIEISRNEVMQDLILQKVEEFEPKKIQIIDILLSASEIEVNEFFKIQMNGLRYRSIKDASNILNIRGVVKCQNNYYYEKTK